MPFTWRSLHVYDHYSLSEHENIFVTNIEILSIFLCKYFVWIPVVCEVGFIMVLHQASDKLLVNKFKLGSVSNLFMSERFFKFYSSENDIFLELITSKSSGVCCYFNKDLLQAMNAISNHLPPDLMANICVIARIKNYG